ncbi:hypothetical protein [Actinomadura livida]|uniref:Uncharacterized protein n=1 Tax=Actinomadura livida TaxID=79909 RepID=A0A7W7IAS9_9ACTN|nr:MULTISPECIES: hypothetical protein [Actinomadura]MBB4773565.1 hypothetical protein [Actinomadura catellatispora]GGU09201.1 hypothetical protein GCM10010208_37070 [Actinomadura livida]
MTCRWCGNDNVLGRRMCPHCGEDTRRLEEAFAPEAPPEEPAEPPFDGLRSTAAMVGKSLAVSAVAVLMLVGGAKTAHSQWPETMWPRSLPTYEPTGPEQAGGSPAPSTDAASCARSGEPVTDATGTTFDRWYCAIERPGDLYEGPDASTPVSGYLREQESWFACQTEGTAEPEGGGTTWLYTQGDDQYTGEGWGYFPAGWVDSAWNTEPVPVLPSCTP